MTKPLTISIIAAEPSGDVLAATIIQAIRGRFPNVRFVGVTGPNMRAAGCDSLADIEDLSVMGYVEVLRKLPKLLWLQNRLKWQLRAVQPDLHIGIDAPDFNLGIARYLKQQGIKTLQVVCPSVWAWKPERIKKIKRAVNHVCAFFPFETDHLTQAGIPATTIGHPLADQIALTTHKARAREALGLEETKPTLAILPGSRKFEVTALLEPFLQTARICQKQLDLQIAIPVAQASLRPIIAKMVEQYSDCGVSVFDEQAHTVLEAADVVLLASGTAALEALLFKRPMVMGYKLAKLTEWIARRSVQIDVFSLPNLLSGKRLVPEFTQENLVPEKMAPAILERFRNQTLVTELEQAFDDIHQQLRLDAKQRVLTVVERLLEI